MHSLTFLIAALTGFTQAMLHPDLRPINHLLKSRDISLADLPLTGLQSRDIDTCAAVGVDAVLEILSDAPVPPEIIVKYVTENINSLDLSACVEPTLTGALGTAYSSYVEDFESWRTRHFDDFQSIYSACSDVPEFMDGLPTEPGCSDRLAEVTSGVSGSEGSGGPSMTFVVTPTGSANETIKTRTGTEGSVTSGPSGTGASSPTPTPVGGESGAEKVGASILGAVVGIVALLL